MFIVVTSMQVPAILTLHRYSSSESDSDEGHGAFVRAAGHTTTRAEKRNSSMSSNSASALSLPSSVASSQEFQANGSENRPSTDPVPLESGFHRRYQHNVL